MFLAGWIYLLEFIFRTPLQYPTRDQLIVGGPTFLRERARIHTACASQQDPL